MALAGQETGGLCADASPEVPGITARYNI